MVDKTNIDNPHFWFPLDNAAKIYPAVQTGEHTTVFRISAVFRESIHIRSLQHAISLTEKRFPYFRVRLCKGLFWYYLECTDHAMVPVLDQGRFCKAFDGDSEGRLLFRIPVRKNKISVEFSHILTDGQGALVFLLTLLANYLTERGTLSGPIGAMKDPLTDEEFEDAYNRYFKTNIPGVIRYSQAFHLPYPIPHKPKFRTISAVVPLDIVKEKAREKKISITDYLTSVYLYVLQDIYNEIPAGSWFRRRKILRVQVPVNLRKIFPSKTMRNFSLFVLPEIDLRLGDYSFDEIIKMVYHKMQIETDDKLISKIISRNVGSERKLFVRGIPLFVKSIVLHHKYFTAGANQYSGVLTNLGKIELPPEMAEKIESFGFVPPPPNRKLKINCGIIGFNGSLVITFGNITRSTELEKRFFRFLTQQGIPVKLTR
jgi:hypothetical protein